MAPVLAMVACLAAPSGATALPQVPFGGNWVPNDPVSAIAQHGDTTYIGGEFSYIGPNSGSGIVLRKSDAELAHGVPGVSGGSVEAVLPDGAGGWWIGGGFTHVGGAPRAGLAHVGPFGSLLPFDVGISSGDAVNDIEFSNNGDRLFVAGSFNELGGETRNGLGAIQLSDNSVTAWDPDVQGIVNDIAVHPDQNFLWAGGSFSMVGTSARDNFAEIRTDNGLATGVFTNGTNFAVSSVEVFDLSSAANNELIYIGGSFTDAFGSARNGIARLDFNTATVQPWNPNVTSSIFVTAFVRDVLVAPGGNPVYVAGGFDKVGTADRDTIAAIDSGTANATSFDPNPGGAVGDTRTEVTSLALDGSTLYAGGNFSSIGGQDRNGLAALDTGSGNTTGWDGNVGEEVHAIAPAGDDVFVGGQFTSAKGVLRSGLAAYDRHGTPTAWNPGVDGGSVFDLLVSPDGQTAYAAGGFSEVGSQPRNGLAAITAAGDVTPWNPDAGGSDVFALERNADGSIVYAGGGFNTVGGATRNNLAALRASDGGATDWNPDLNSDVSDLLLKPDGSALYAAGDFDTVGTDTRESLAEISTSSGAATPWHPDFDNEVFTIDLSPDGGTLYAGGDFGTVGGSTTRNRAAAVSTSSGEPTSWDPNANSDVRALDVSPDGSVVFAGGDFQGAGSIGGADRNFLAELDPTSGAASAWNPAPNGVVTDLLHTPLDLLAGGEFTAIGPYSLSWFARFLGPRPPDPGPGPGPAPGDTTSPVVNDASIDHTAIAVGRQSTPVNVAQRRRVPRRTRFRWTLSETARTQIRIQRARPGRRVRGRCVRPNRRHRARRRCIRWRTRGTLGRPGAAGANSTRFTGRIGRRRLRRGRYRAVFVATDAAGNRSQPRRVRFRIVRPRPRR